MNSNLVFKDGIQFPMAPTVLLFLLYGDSIETELEAVSFKCERYRRDALWTASYLEDCLSMKELWDEKRDNFLLNL